MIPEGNVLLKVLIENKKGVDICELGKDEITLCQTRRSLNCKAKEIVGQINFNDIELSTIQSALLACSGIVKGDHPPPKGVTLNQRIVSPACFPI